MYNVEKYIEECLDSVILQWECSVEVICIDDGSKDNTYSIVEHYKKNFLIMLDRIFFCLDKKIEG